MLADAWFFGALCDMCKPRCMTWAAPSGDQRVAALSSHWAGCPVTPLLALCYSTLLL